MSSIASIYEVLLNLPFVRQMYFRLGKLLKHNNKYLLLDLEILHRRRLVIYGKN